MGTRETIKALSGGLEPIDDAFDPVTELELLNAEASLGVKLPALFREIQKAYGCCRFSGEALIPVKGAEPLSIATILGFKGVSGNLLLEYQAQPDLQAQGRVPIAEDKLNNHYVWDAVNGQVLFIDYVTRQPPLLVALDFEAFLNEIWVGPNH
jgi:SMI1-KNR4 cell-wall